MINKLTFETYLESWDQSYLNVLNALPNAVNPIVSLAFSSFYFSSGNQFGGMTLTAEQIKQLISIIHQKNGVAVISYGGATGPYYPTSSNYWPDAVKMAQSIVDSANQYGFDGIDLDIEGDVWTANFAIVLVNLFKEIRKNAPTLRLTCTIPAQGWSTPYVQIAQGVVDVVDSINFMEYDLWVDSGKTYPQQIDWDIEYYQNNWNIPANKIAVGLMPGVDDMKRTLKLADISSIVENACNRGNIGVFTWDANRDFKGLDGNVSYAYTNAIMSKIASINA